MENLLNNCYKFRAWDKINKKMYYIQGFIQRLNTIRIWYEEDDMIYNQSFHKDNIIIMQYIKIKDKNSKEIYEKDIVKATQPNSYLGDMNDLYKIIYYEKYALFCFECIKSDNPYRLEERFKIPLTRNNHPYFITSSRVEIIGNIYENLELSKEST